MKYSKSKVEMGETDNCISLGIPKDTETAGYFSAILVWCTYDLSYIKELSFELFLKGLFCLLSRDMAGMFILIKQDVIQSL